MRNPHIIIHLDQEWLDRALYDGDFKQILELNIQKAAAYELSKLLTKEGKNDDSRRNT